MFLSIVVYLGKVLKDVLLNSTESPLALFDIQIDYISLISVKLSYIVDGQFT